MRGVCSLYYNLMPASDTRFRYVGRFDQTDPNRVLLGWSNSTIEANFTGTSLIIAMENAPEVENPVDPEGKSVPGQPNWFKVFLDDCEYKVPTNGFDPIFITDRLKDGSHKLKIIKVTETSPMGGGVTGGYCVFKGIYITGSLCNPPPEPKLKLQITGASVSQGYGILGDCVENEDSTVCCTEKSDYQDSTETYGYKLAERYGAEINQVSYSGRGVYTNWGNYNEDSTLPKLYERQLALTPEVPMNPGKFIPDVIIVDAGSNDYADGVKWVNGKQVPQVKPTKEQFITAYSAWIMQMKKYYPNATIIMVGWFDSCIQRKRCEYMQEVADHLTQMGYKDIYFYNIDWNLDLLTEGGCNKHPNLLGHERAFEKILDAGFEKDTGWSPVKRQRIRKCKVKKPSMKESFTNTNNALGTGDIVAIVLGCILFLIIVYYIWQVKK